MFDGILLQLGELMFSTDKRSYNELARKSNYRWAQLERLGYSPAHQWLGPGEDNITIKGIIYPGHQPYGNGEVVGVQQIDEIRQVAAQGIPLDLITGMGDALGRWVIKSVNETDTVLMSNGAPRKQEFDIDLAFYGEDAGGAAGIVFAGGQFRVPRLSNLFSAAGGLNFGFGLNLPGISASGSNIGG